MAASPNDLLNATFDTVNQALNSFVTDFSTSVVTEISGLVVAALVLTYIVLGILILRGSVAEPFGEVGKKMLFQSVIITIALSAGIYQSKIANVLLTVPDQLVNSLMATSVGSSNVQGGSGAAQVLDEMLYKGMDLASRYVSGEPTPASTTTPPPTTPPPTTPPADKPWYDIELPSVSDAFAGMVDTIQKYICAGLIIIATVCMIIVAAFYLFAAKILLALFLGVGPIFICMLLWQPTQQYFWNWFSAILNTTLTMVFVLGIFSIFAKVFDTFLLNIDPTDTTVNHLTESGLVMFLGIMTMGILLIIPQYVAQLVGGGGGGVFGAIQQVAAGASSAGGGGASKAVSGASNSNNMASSSRSGAGAYSEARKGGQGRMAAAKSGAAAYGDSRRNYFKARYERNLHRK